MKELFKVRIYTAGGSVDHEVFFNNIVDAVKAWAENAVKWSATNPTIWAWYEEKGRYIRLSDVNYFGVPSVGNIAEYLTRMFLYDDPENKRIFASAVQHYRKHAARAIELYRSVDEARAIYKMADPNRVYSFKDDITGATISGNAEETTAFIDHHDKAHDLKTSWGPINPADVEAWSLLEVLYN